MGHTGGVGSCPKGTRDNQITFVMRSSFARKGIRTQWASGNWRSMKMERIEMRYSPKTAVLSLVFLTGVAVAAHAQSVANLPPAGGAPTSIQPPASSSPLIAGPNPGTNVSISSGPAYQKPADWNSNPAYHPYSTSGVGPNPGTNVSANNEPYSPPAGGDSPATHPYSQGGTGPTPGANVTIPNSH
jgi:hypothetical protein